MFAPISPKQIFLYEADYSSLWNDCYASSFNLVNQFKTLFVNSINFVSFLTGYISGELHNV